MYPDLNIKHLASMVVREIKNLAENDKLDIGDLRYGKDLRLALAKSQNKPAIDMSQQYWHGGGITNITGLLIAGTGITLTGSGTTDSPYTISSTATGTVTSVTSADANATITNPTTTPVITIVSAPKLQTARTIGGVSFDGTANITVATATGGFTVSGGNLALGANSISMSGSIGTVLTRVTKLWATDVDSTNMFTVGGTSLSSTFSPIAGSASIVTIGTVTSGKLSTGAVIGGVTMTLGSDASYDIYYRNSSGILTRLGNGTTGQYLGANTGAAPSWQTPSSAGFSPSFSRNTVFETAARFTITLGGTATNSFNINGLRIDTNATGDTTQIKWNIIGNGGNDNTFLGSPTFSIGFGIGGTMMTTGNTFWGIGQALTVGTDYTPNHIGFKVLIVAGVVSLYATQADGSTETASSALTTLVVADFVELSLKVNGTSSVDYYWRKNGGAWSSATNLTTHMPGAADTAGCIFWVNNVLGAVDTLFTYNGANYSR